MNEREATKERNDPIRTVRLLGAKPAIARAMGLNAGSGHGPASNPRTQKSPDKKEGARQAMKSPWNMADWRVPFHALLTAAMGQLIQHYAARLAAVDVGAGAGERAARARGASRRSVKVRSKLCAFRSSNNGSRRMVEARSRRRFPVRAPLAFRSVAIAAPVRAIGGGRDASGALPSRAHGRPATASSRGTAPLSA